MTYVISLTRDVDFYYLEVDPSSERPSTNPIPANVSVYCYIFASSTDFLIFLITRSHAQLSVIYFFNNVTVSLFIGQKRHPVLLFFFL